MFKVFKGSCSKCLLNGIPRIIKVAVVRGTNPLFHRSLIHYFLFGLHNRSFSGLPMAYEITDYDREKEKIQDFLTTFYHEDTGGTKLFPYDKQITLLAEREQVF